jgi:3-hydroxybutyryl-CoA dehydrogenase
MSKEIKNITVIGAGTMGNGIAHVFAMKGFKVVLMDISDQALVNAKGTIGKNLDRLITKDKISENEKASTLNNLRFSSSLKEAVTEADLVVEAASENLKIKTKVFSDLDQFAPEHAILATNTSSISITKIAAVTKRPEKVIGMHFMNPVPIMKLVEIINGFGTSKATTDTIVRLTKKIGKVPISVNDYPGFIANRILMPMINEAVYALYEGVAGVDEIDGIMKLGMAHPMGPLQLADFIGLDVCFAILNVLYKGFGNPKYAPCPLLVKMVNAGNLGKKTKLGFYDYTNGNKELKIAPAFLKEN